MSRARSIASTLVAAILLPALVLPANAGDILRGGTPLNSSRRTASAAANAGADTAALSRANARDRLARTTQAIDAVKAMQLAARAAARDRPRLADPARPGKFLPGVRNGLGPRGLQVADGVPKDLRKPEKGEDPLLWIGADLPAETRRKGDVKVTITQTEQQALLNWKKFDLGKKTTLVFDQSAGGRDASKWVAFNKVSDPSGKPSQILGSIQAAGQVYVINQNGIIFGGTSQVNVHTLTASALPINDGLVSSGLLDNPSAQFLFDYQQTENLLGAITAESPSVTLRQIPDPRTTLQITGSTRNNGTVTTFNLVEGKDYTLAVGSDRRTTLTLTEAGIAKALPTGRNLTTESFSAAFGAATGNILVEKGARLFSPTSAASVGGRIALVGANVKNRGTIETPDGQTILAAGLQVGFAAHRSEDPSLRGLDTFVGAVADPTSTGPISAGEATNVGLIDVPRGNATIAGAKIRQNGAIDSTTSVSLNGRIDLRANYDAVGNPLFKADSPTDVLFVPRSTGTVFLGKDSVMRILPELDNPAKVIGAKLALTSSVQVQGGAIHLGAGSMLLAPSANVDFSAGRWFYTASTNASVSPKSEFHYTGGQIYADRGALVDVAGTPDAFAPLTQNILTLQFRGAELSDVPLQRDGLLRATDLTIDIRKTGTFNGRDWAGTPLADATGFVGLIERTVGQLTQAGGTVSFQAGDSVVLQRGSIVDVSGGYLNYEGGFVETSRVTAGNRIIDIADATPDLVYDGLYTAQNTQVHEKWGIVETFKNPLTLSRRHYEDAYISGAAGGRISVQAPTMALDAQFAGQTVAGPRQLRDSSGKTNLPAASKLDLKFRAEKIVDTVAGILILHTSPARPRVIIDPSISQRAPAPFALDALGNAVPLEDDRRRTVVLSPDLLNFDGFGSLAVENVEGRITVPLGVKIEGQPGGSVDFQAANIDVRGSIVIPGGDLSFTAYNISPYAKDALTPLIGTPDAPTQFRLATPNKGRFFLGGGGTLSTAGLVVDNRFSADNPLAQPIEMVGGSVRIASYDAKLSTGSVIDVSGGVELDLQGKASYGDAGSISILAGRDPQPGLEAIAGGRLALAGELRGYSGAAGGSLTVQAIRVRVGPDGESGLRNFDVSPDFFNRGGFSRFSLVGIAEAPLRLDPFRTGAPLSAEDAFRTIPDNRFVPGLTIAPGLEIQPVVQSWVARAVGGVDGGVSLETTVLPEGLQSPRSLSFAATGATDLISALLVSRADLTVGEGALIRAGALGSVTLRGNTVEMLGSVDAPGGSITIAGAARYPLLNREASHAQPTVYIGPDSRLSAAGATLLTPDPLGNRTGRVLGGGTIAISGNILAEAGSTLDVSGATGQLDFNPEQIGLDARIVPVTSGLTESLFSQAIVPVQVDSDGGAITLTGGQMLLVDSTLRGAAGGPTALGGSLAVSSGRFYRPAEQSAPVDVNLVVRQEGSILRDFVRATPVETDPEETAKKSGREPEYVAADRGVRKVVIGPNGKAILGRGYFSVDQFTEGGFDSLDLGGVVKFSGPVTINARQSISVAAGRTNADGTVTGGGVLTANDAVTLRAPHVVLGSPFAAPLQPDTQSLKNIFGGGTPFFFGLRYGAGSLTVHAKLIDIGNLAVRGVRVTNLVADDGDIRGQGVLAVPGHLNIRAGQIYPITAGQFTISAYDYRLPRNLTDDKPDTKEELAFQPGSITILASGSRQLPLSAGGELNVYASEIVQGGVLRAPLGTINLGWDGTGDARSSTIVGLVDKAGTLIARPLPTTRKLELGAGSETSVSAVDAVTGRELLIPYGLVTSSDSWIDPRGIDITVGGVPSKAIRLSAERLNARRDSVIDVSGGGNLYAYRWVPGLGGTRDILASEGSFAVIRGYEANFAPAASFNQSDLAQAALDPTREIGDANLPGYANSNLKVGDRVHLGASAGLPEGDYTLLPARYALLPNAVLVTPQSGAPVGTLAMPDGSSLVSGTRYNDLNSARDVPSLSTRFEVAPPEVVRARVEFENFYANNYLRRSALDVEAPIPLLPVDAGHLVFQAQNSMHLNGIVRARPKGEGIGATVDISSPLDILVTGPGGPKGEKPKNTIVLKAARLNSFGAESLLIGGVREFGDDGTTVVVQTGNITVGKLPTPLSGPEIILASKNSLTLERGARIEQTGEMAGQADRLLIDGDGLLLRVSSDPTASIDRTGITASTAPTMTIKRGAEVSGTSLILDSSYATALSPRARLLGDYVSLSSGQISLRLGDPGDVPDTFGLVLGGDALRGLQGAKGLSLLSYSSIDIYGTGRLAIDGELELHAGEIRGYNQGDGEVRFTAGSIVLDNGGRGTRPGRSLETSGRLVFSADTIELGERRMDIDQYASVELNAARGVQFTGRGRLFVQNDLTVVAPVLSGENSATSVVRAGGSLRLLAGKSTAEPAFAPGLGAGVTFEGDRIVATSDILFPSGLITLRAREGDVSIGGRLDVGGTIQELFDRTIATNAGQITLAADRGSVNVAKSAAISVAAQTAGGNAGTLSIRTPEGDLTLAGTLSGSGGKNGTSGSFLLDVGQAERLAALNDTLDKASFLERRSIRVRTGDVTLGGTLAVERFDLSADQGSITVTGKIDASGETGGAITLQAFGDLTLTRGSELTVAGRNFDAAGKGGSILLEAGAQTNGIVGPGILDIRAGAALDLSVAAQNASSAEAGQFSGILHLRAPRTAANDDLQIASIGGSIQGASHVVVEGYKIYDLTPATGSGTGLITTALRTTMKNDGIAFAGAAGDPATPGYTAMLARLLGTGNQALADTLSIRPGIELINRSGDLTLGAQNSPASNDWNLATFRFGPKSAPGVLTMRAKGDLIFFNALQDGFQITRLALSYLAPLMAPNPLLPLNAQSWSYRLSAGADLSAADFAAVLPLNQLGANAGSVRIGKNVSRGGIASSSGSNATTLSAVTGSNASPNLILETTQTRYQVIRTGSGDIDIHAGRDVQLLNQFATIYTAGTLVADPSLKGEFDLPNLGNATSGQLALGTLQQTTAYPVQYSLGGGNITITAGNDIAHRLRATDGTLTDDSSRELPINWLYRRGYIDPATGQFGASTRGEIASTTWWVDFANFFEGVGALGGGNVNLIAGRDVLNVDGLVPTNARLPKGRPDASEMVELGGGDLVVRAGRNIDGGVYYVERGTGVLEAGNEIRTNATRSPSLTILAASSSQAAPLPEQNWLPTTLFLGKGSFDVSARGDILLGPTVNPFLLAGGYNNIYRYKTYFSTYAPTNTVNVTSLGGSASLRLEASRGGGATLPMISQWLQNVLLFNPSGANVTAANSQPWLRLNESNVSSFAGVAGLMPATLRVTAPAGDVNIIGDLTLAPSASGNLELNAGGSINGLQPNGINGLGLVTWYSSRINVSDANPASIPQVASPFAYQTLVANDNVMISSGTDFLQFVDELFEETGAINTVLETKQKLHGEQLHADDPEPLRLYAKEGSISGFTLFSPKRARILAGEDIADIAFYVQNLGENDVTTVAAGRDIIAYSANSPLRSAALAAGNIIAGNQPPQPGDIQLGGAGVLQVLAGRDLDLGTGASNIDGTATGITTIGNRRNPFLPFDGADIIIGAGIGPSSGLGNSRLKFQEFIDDILETPAGASHLAEALGLFEESDLASVAAIAKMFNELPGELQAGVLLKAFSLTLRDAGREFGTPGAPGFGTYTAGFEAIAALFGDGRFKGDVQARGRDIRTRNGGEINIFAPGGELRLASNVIGNPDVPPGIITETGGDISIFTHRDVNIGVGRIFTLRGGNQIIWSSTGNIAAGSASKTVASAPPTRVLIDPQSADVETDLAGLSTGGGIGVLATVAGVAPGDVDLIAPAGFVDAGDAGIRVSGNLNIAAVEVLNADNIAVSGASIGVPTAAPPSSAPIAAPPASNASAANNNAANELANQTRQLPAPELTPSSITVEVIGYGGSGEEEDEDEDDDGEGTSASAATPVGGA